MPPRGQSRTSNTPIPLLRFLAFPITPSGALLALHHTSSAGNIGVRRIFYSEEVRKKRGIGGSGMIAYKDEPRFSRKESDHGDY
jgi:hypothetical protein